MMDKENLILETFLRLTNRTYPYGTEEQLVEMMIQTGLFPEDIQKDKHGNYFYKIGNSRTIFASHLDTVSREATEVVHTFNGNIIGTDGKTTLGADDKAGVTVMLHLMRNNIPGLYYFFIGEEVGCIGSGLASSQSMTEFKGKYDRIISFDRRGTDSVITYQSSTRCCSDEFADSLAKQLNLSGLSYKKDDGGVYTDSAEFTDIIPECTNLSVGYYKEHTVNETQDIKHLESLAKALLLVDWENLPTKRDMTKKEFKSYNYNSNTGWNWKSNHSSTNWRSRDYGYHDDWHEDNSSFSSKKYYDEDEDWPGQREYGKFKKTRRSGKAKSYFDSGDGNLVPFSKSVKSVDSLSKNNQNYYDTIIDKVLESKLTKDDLEKVKDQFLDMESDSDRVFYEYLLGNVV